MCENHTHGTLHAHEHEHDGERRSHGNPGHEHLEHVRDKEHDRDSNGDGHEAKPADVHEH